MTETHSPAAPLVIDWCFRMRRSQFRPLGRIRSVDFLDRLSDAELLARTAKEPQAFGAFYRRHERLVLRYLMSRCGNAELTADFTAETFVKALEGAESFDPTRSGGTSAVPWLLTIARNTLVTSVRRGVVARILEDREYDEIASSLVETGKTETALPEIERMLITTAAAQRKGAEVVSGGRATWKSRWRRRSRPGAGRVVAFAAIAVLIGGTAIAATFGLASG